MRSVSSEFKHMVRIAGSDLDGTKKVGAALADLKGVGYNLANVVLNLLKIDNKVRIGMLSDQKIAEIEQSLRDLSAIGVPTWTLNRRKDLETGANYHVVGSDLELMIKSDISRQRSVGSWIGVRHSLGLKVRGQRTRTSGRGGRSVGVKKPTR